jgi:hypothetical protein
MRDSVVATAGSELAGDSEDDDAWIGQGGPATLRRLRSGPSRRTESRRRLEREISPTRSQGSRPRGLTRSALEKIGGGPAAFPPPRISGDMLRHPTHRSELSAMARKDLNNARWSVPKLAITASFQEFTTWLD